MNGVVDTVAAEAAVTQDLVSLHAGEAVFDAGSDLLVGLLIEIAGFLHEGRPDAELTTMAREPRTPEDVAKQVARFAGFADDQYLDAIALFAALSTRLRTTGSDFVKIDDDTGQRFLDNVLKYGQYVAPEAR